MGRRWRPPTPDRGQAFADRRVVGVLDTIQTSPCFRRRYARLRSFHGLLTPSAGRGENPRFPGAWACRARSGREAGNGAGLRPRPVGESELSADPVDPVADAANGEAVAGGSTQHRLAERSLGRHRLHRRPGNLDVVGMGEEGQLRLLASSVIVIGAGPVGENVADYFVRGGGLTAALVESELLGDELRSKNDKSRIAAIRDKWKGGAGK